MNNTTARQRLKEVLCSQSLQMNTGRDYELHSGEKTKIYVDAKLTTLDPEAFPLVGRVFLDQLQEQMWWPEAVGGLTVGADPIALAISTESFKAGHRINAFIVRKEAKKHGMNKFIEGLPDPKGRRVVIIDDVCTRGDSTAQAVQKALEAEMIVLGAICLVDREHGASNLLRERFGVYLRRIFTLSELVSAVDPSLQALEHVHV
jgi:orotate phosphoribosyltransferase